MVEEGMALTCVPILLNKPAIVVNHYQA